MIERWVMKNDVWILRDGRVGRCEPGNVGGLPEDYTFSVIEFVGIYRRLRNPVKISECSKDRWKGEDYDILECGEEEPAGRPTRVGRTMISICFPIGLSGDISHARISHGEVGRRDFNVSGKKRGMISRISQPLAIMNSDKETCDQTEI